MNTGYVTANAELDLYYEEAGTGALTVLLVPGWTMSTAVFGRQLAYFDEHNICRCVTFDPRAHGRTIKTSGGHTYAQHGATCTHSSLRCKSITLLLPDGRSVRWPS